MPYQSLQTLVEVKSFVLTRVKVYTYAGLKLPSGRFRIVALHLVLEGSTQNST